MDQKIRVLICDDHTIVLEGMRMLLENFNDIKVIGEAKNGREAIRLALSLAPDVAVIDIGMPLLNGIEAGRQISLRKPEVRIIFLSGRIAEEHLDQLARFKDISGLVAKEDSSSDLVAAIRCAAKGATFFSRCMDRRLRQRLKLICKEKPPFRNRRLTARELEVLQLVAEGFPNKRIASEMEISIKTVEKFRQNMMDKLDIHDIAGLTRYAHSRGIVEDLNPPLDPAPVNG